MPTEQDVGFAGGSAGPRYGFVRFLALVVKRPVAAAASGVFLLAAFAVLALAGRLPMHLKTVDDGSLHQFGISLAQPSPLDGQPQVTSAAALAVVQRSYAGMGPVTEEVLARVHISNGTFVNDRICWVLVQPTGPTDSAGHSTVFGLEVIDATSGSVLFAGGQMATGGGP